MTENNQNPGVPVPEAQLDTMRQRGGTWACYENKAFDSAAAGERIYIKYGPGCTYETPPPRAPSHGAGWRYLLVGFVDLEKGVVL